MPPSPTDAKSPIHNSKARMLYRFLRARLSEQDADEYYFKCREIADDVGLSAKEIGHLIRHLQDADLDIRIEKWSWSRATTWRVRPRDP